MGILFLIFLTVAIINDSLKNDKILYNLLMISIILQLYWNIFASVYDVKKQYSSGEAVSQYLKGIGIEDKSISGVDFWAVQVNPYFEENIYDNYTYSYHLWSKNERKKMGSDYLFFEKLGDSDIYIIPFYYYYDNSKFNSKEPALTFSTFYQNNIMEILDATGKYKKREFKSTMCFKNLEFEVITVYVYEKINI